MIPDIQDFQGKAMLKSFLIEFFQKKDLAQPIKSKKKKRITINACII